jgi:hypothetical protein
VLVVTLSEFGGYSLRFSALLAKAIGICLFGSAFLCTPAAAQVPGLASSTTTSATGPPGGGTGGAASTPAGGGGGASLAFESEAIAYEAVNELALEIANGIPANLCPAASHANEAATTVAPKPAPRPACQILLAIPANVNAITSFLGFKAAATLLKQQYEKFLLPKKGGLLAPLISPFISAGAGILSALKGQTTQTSATFSANDQALYSDLEAAIATNGKSQNLLVTAYPGELATAYDSDINTLIGSIMEARQKTVDKLNEAHAPDDNGSAAKKDQGGPQSVAYDPLTSDLKDLEEQFSALQGIISNPNSNSSILLGAALLRKLGTTYGFLTVSDDVAGGGTRANQYFLINLFLPAPHPSYNGGAVVSYSLRNQDGDFEGAGTLRFVFGYTKWHEPRARKKGEDHFANFKWSGKKQMGAWEPIY